MPFFRAERSVIMNLHKQLAINNACYKAGRRIKPQGLMIHSTGANNPNLRRYVQPDDGLLGWHPFGNHFNVDSPGGRHVCVHAFIGKLKDGTIATYQILPWNMEAWHCGAGPRGSGNKTHISVEICEDNLRDPVYFNKVYREAVEFTAYICKEFGFIETDIICHSEGHALGIASNHADVMHWFPRHGKSMDTFRADVKALLHPASADKPPVTNAPSVSPGKPPVPPAFTLKRLLKLSATVTANTLNFRTGPSLLRSVIHRLKRGDKLTVLARKGAWTYVSTGGRRGYVYSKYISLGNYLRGEDVRAVQKALKAAGYDPGAIDGVFGLKTLAAVLAFQAARGLTADGIVGAKTAKALGGVWAG